MNDPTILILTSLSSGEKHGYALLQDIERYVGVRLGPGTLTERSAGWSDAA